MNRFVIAAAVAALFGARADAQVIAGTASGYPPPGPIAGQGTSYFYKSGNVLIGSAGYFPYDTGEYALAGFDGVARYSGYFTMMPSPGAVGFSGACSPRDPATGGIVWSPPHVYYAPLANPTGPDRNHYPYLNPFGRW